MQTDKYAMDYKSLY